MHAVLNPWNASFGDGDCDAKSQNNLVPSFINSAHNSSHHDLQDLLIFFFHSFAPDAPKSVNMGNRMSYRSLRGYFTTFVMETTTIGEQHSIVTSRLSSTFRPLHMSSHKFAPLFHRLPQAPCQDNLNRMTYV